MSRYPSKEVARGDQQFRKEDGDPWPRCVSRDAADAKRYRWLRLNPTFLGWDADYRPDEVDRAVDKEMSK